MNTDEIIKNGRRMLKPDWRTFDFENVDGNKGIKPLPIEKPFDSNAKQIKLIPFGETTCGNESVSKIIANRRSTRKFAQTPLTLEELSYLLWTTQGLKEIYNLEWGSATKVVPSAGMCHCIETYLYIDKVEGIEKGIYRYLPVEQTLLEVNTEPGLSKKINHAIFGQLWDSAVVFLWSAIPYKIEYGYSTVAHKMVAFEAGHVCQNLYLAAESISCGCCAIGAYYQDEVDALAEVDGENEFIIYIGVVGKYLP